MKTRAKNFFKKNKTTIISTGCILVALLILGISLSSLFNQKTERDMLEENVYTSLEHYATETGILTVEDVQLIARSIAHGLDEELLDSLQFNLSDEDLKTLLLYVDDLVYDNMLDLPDATKKDLTSAAIASLIDNYNIDKTEDALNLYEDKINKMQTELTTLQTTLASVTNKTDFTNLTEEEIQQILTQSGLSKEQIDQWIAAANANVTLAYKAADEEILRKVNLANTELTQKLTLTQNDINTIYNNISTINNKKMDVDVAEQRISVLNQNIEQINKAIYQLDGETGAEADKLKKELTELRAQVEASKKTLTTLINNSNTTLTTNMTNIHNELQDADADLQKAIDDASLRSKNDLETLKTELNNLISGNEELNSENLSKLQYDLTQALKNSDAESRDALLTIQTQLMQLIEENRVNGEEALNNVNYQQTTNLNNFKTETSQNLADLEKKVKEEIGETVVVTATTSVDDEGVTTVTFASQTITDAPKKSSTGN